jgi:hypothetical protein
VADEAGAAGSLAGAVRLAGAGTLRRDDAAFLDGLGALTVQVRAKADAVGHERGVINLGGFGGDAAIGLTIRYAGAGGGIFAKVATTAGAATLTTKAGAQGTAWQALALAWASGDARPALYLDGALAEAASGSALGTGAATTDLAGPLVLGAGARDSAAGGWQGLLDEVRLRAGKLPAAWLAAERANRAEPDGFYGAGPEDAPDDERPGAVAVPVAASTRAGAYVDVDVLAAAVVPAGAAAPTLAAVGQPQHGTATVIAGKVRYAPAAGYVGADAFAYTIASGGKASAGRVGIRVDGPRPPTCPSRATSSRSRARPGWPRRSRPPGPATTSCSPTAPTAAASRPPGPARGRAGRRPDRHAARRQDQGQHQDHRGARLALGALARGRQRRPRRRRRQDEPLQADRHHRHRGRGEPRPGRGDRPQRALGHARPRHQRRPAGRRPRRARGAAHPPQLDPRLLRRAGHQRPRGAPARPEQLGQPGPARRAGRAEPVREGRRRQRVHLDQVVGNVVRLNTLLDCEAHLTNRHGKDNQIVANWLEDTFGMRLHDRGGRAVGNRLRAAATGCR